MKPCPLTVDTAELPRAPAQVEGVIDLIERNWIGSSTSAAGPCGTPPHELQRVARLQQVAGAAVAVLHPAGQHVDQLGAGVLVERERVAALGQRDQHRLEGVVGRAHDAERLVAAARPGALVLDVQALARLDVQDVLLLVQPAEERGHRDLERLGQPGQRGQARRGLGVLDLGQHALGHPALRGELADRPAELQPELPDPLRRSPRRAPPPGRCAPRRSRHRSAAASRSQSGLLGEVQRCAPPRPQVSTARSAVHCQCDGEHIA